MAVTHAELANAIRALAMDAVEQAKSGHPGMPMGMADVATVLFRKFLKFDAAAPKWPDRDRFVLSAGHGSMLIYALLHLTGYEGVTLDEIKRFRQLGAITAGHPEYGHCPGVETTTGPLGQGLATSVGMAIAERMLSQRFGTELVDHRTWVIAGDGCLMEGISHEAVDLAGHLKLSKLTVLFDDNSITIDGATSLATSIDHLRRFEAAGWAVERIDGHSPDAIEAAMTRALSSTKPTLIACRTVIGFGAPKKQGTAGVHGAPLGAEELAAAKKALNWPYGPFEVPDAIRAEWLKAGHRGAKAHADWEHRRSSLDDDAAWTFADHLEERLTEKASKALDELAQSYLKECPKIASRQASEIVIDAVTKAQPNIVGGSADLTHSNLTKGKSQKPITPDDFTGSYIHFGVREHGMGAALNGLSLHGGFKAYGGTFLVFADYARPSIRLSALMHQPVVYVMTHDSIGLGEDGPTHQPVEHVASLRAMPNLLVFRPADARETVEAWRFALQQTSRPSVLCLSRQALSPLPEGEPVAAGVAAGAYVVSGWSGARDVTLLATGSEVEIALKAAAELAGRGIMATVVSMPCWELFREQSEEYRAHVLGTAPFVAVEAAAATGWHEWIGNTGAFVGMKGFGASAPAAQLYEHFEITPKAVVAQALKAIGAEA
ncbi:transketolase [Aestuariivirga sp.]|uniref:transketolase n=1 Tax=Aestuariivirga sp. TaxID=2650926 RepID=UPI0039E48271